MPTFSSQIAGSRERPILLDLTIPPGEGPHPVIVFVHGFKGFKDWGHFSLVSRRAAQAGFAFLKFNLSHNGTTPEAPLEFGDLEAFGQNNFEMELADVRHVIDWITDSASEKQLDPQHIYVVGHSRGGGLAVLAADLDRRIKGVVTWAAVSDFEQWLTKFGVEDWRKAGVIYIPNARTRQNMPLDYQLYMNLMVNLPKFSIERAARALEVPMFIIHGRQDEAVSIDAATNLSEWNPDARLLLVKEAGHTFGVGHPFEGEILPAPAELVVTETLKFLEELI